MKKIFTGLSVKYYEGFTGYFLHTTSTCFVEVVAVFRSRWNPIVLFIRYGGEISLIRMPLRNLKELVAHFFALYK